MNRPSALVSSPTSNSEQKNRSNRDALFSVILSFVPILGIFIIVLFVDKLIEAAYGEMGWFLYFFIGSSIFSISNVISLVILWPIMNFSIYWRSSLLTNVFLLGFLIASYQNICVSFGYYLMCLSFFHLSEFVTTALFNEDKIRSDSFLLNHSLEYVAAAFAGWLEFFLETLIFPNLKLNPYLRYIGLTLIICGEIFRKLAMYTAGTNFNHFVQESHKTDHVLVISGVYAFVRHPSYFGWFFWSIGTQILLGNPICTFLYTIISWKFFNSRIVYEEFYLLKFFGRQYHDYQNRVPSGIPFVKGYILQEECYD